MGFLTVLLLNNCCFLSIWQKIRRKNRRGTGGKRRGNGEKTEGTKRL